MKPHELGRLGETLAAEFLVEKGYKVITRNLKLPGGEVDILCRDGEEIVVVEVKTLADSRYFDPLFRVDYKKVMKLRRLARFIEVRYPERNVRIDAVTVGWVEREVEIRHWNNINS